MSEIAEPADRSSSRRDADRLNNTVAFLVALVASFMAVANIKDGNIVQSMTVQQSKATDSWAFFQAKSLKEALAQAALDQLQIQLDLIPDSRTELRARLNARVDDYTQKLHRYETEKVQIKAAAEGYEQEYARLSVADDQLDMAVACLSMGLALFGITALTHRRWLLVISIGFSLCGFVLGVAGFVGWSMRPEWFVRLLT